MNQPRLRPIILCSVVLILLSSTRLLAQQSQGIIIEPVAHDLLSPRGVAFSARGNLFVVEAGIGDSERAVPGGSGRILELVDTNGDGDYDDVAERITVLDDEPSYNSLQLFRSFHDEPFGLGDLVLLPDDTIFYTKDNPFFEEGPAGSDAYLGNTGVFEVDRARRSSTRVVENRTTINGLVYDEVNEVFYMVDSGRNLVMRVAAAALGTPTDDEAIEIVADMPILANFQQPVPAGLALDPTTGDLLVALFSGFVLDYYGDRISYMPGDAMVVRLDPETGQYSEAVTGLTTAIDVAVDDAGNLFVVELTTEWPLAFTPLAYDLNDPDAEPDAGGYARYTGRVTMIPADGSEPRILMDAVDTPTNITYHDGALYLSTALGTPGRTVWTRFGERTVEGIIYRISGY